MTTLPARIPAALPAVLLAALAPALGAQSLNVDCENAFVPGVPSASYGGAALQPGHWNAFDAPDLLAPIVLAGLDGLATGVTLVDLGGTSKPHDYANNETGTVGDDQALMDDIVDFVPPGIGTIGTHTVGFTGLVNGSYAVYTYARDPQSSIPPTYVSVAGAVEGVQAVGGAWTGAHALGVTYALHHVQVTSGTLAVTLENDLVGFCALNGLQLVQLDGSASSVCAGDGSGAACPCGNSGGPGRGCASSLFAQGALLAGSGTANVAGDTLVLTASSVSNAVATFYQGDALHAGGAGVPFGDGLSCVSGTIVRIASRQAVGNSVSYPVGGEIPISVRGAVPPAGGVRTYQAHYRNAAAFCTPATFNLTNAVRVLWMP